MRLKNKNVLVVGLGKSGQSACQFLLYKKSHVFVYDDNKQNLHDFDCKNVVKIDNVTEDFLINIDLVVVSPGVSVYHKVIKLCYLYKKTIISELQLGLNFCKGKIIAVTGTNGKTTTVNLIEQTLNFAKKRNILAGNVGYPLTKLVSFFNHNYILEVSSFQLETTQIKPNIACVLNVTPNHLDRHFSFTEYLQTKYKIFMQMDTNGTLILNADDENLFKLKNKQVKIFDDVINIKPKIVWFSTENEVDGAFKSGDAIFYKHKNKIYEVCKVNDIKLLGNHNIYNILASICVCIANKIKLKFIKKAISNFKGVEHRLEFVDNINGVDFYNDSKSTTPASTLKAVDSIKKPIVLILGGSDKGLNYDDFAKKLENNVKCVVLTGKIAKKLEKSFQLTNIEYFVESDFYNAVLKAKQLANNGDCILLSPATASFDKFINFEQRGEYFKQIVKKFKI